MTDRAARLKALHAGARALGLDDEARRDLMARVTGRRSARDMTDAQLGAVLAEYDRLRGGRPRQAGGRRGFKPAANPLARKVHAQWGELCRRGAIAHAASAADRRQALRAWCARQLQPGADVLLDPDLLDDTSLRKLVEALKKWIARLDRAAADDAAADDGEAG
ncbi:phage protein GemA/Gp16 family protein [Roseospira goensis]|uniref:Phage gp16-like protein n=1 Tax=Roseospira goensis TaxID=391922 RepID=A0A7W6WMR9_9PROT|nr:phage protein GemA/Gp16 family protein [Roseospira goensis]MBB4287777.1 phage gp16-like protein [Roseospira goensis]